MHIQHTKTRIFNLIILDESDLFDACAENKAFFENEDSE